MVNRKNQLPPSGRVLVPAMALGALALLLTAGLGILGLLRRLNLLVASLIAPGNADASFPKALPDWAVAGVTVMLACGISWGILSVAGHWRRLLLWITLLVLILGWAPVLGLAAHAPDVAAPFVAVLWSGVCALVYAKNHSLAADEHFSEKPHETR